MIDSLTTTCENRPPSVWFTHMKTTVDISDTLFESARRLAVQRGSTMRALIEEGLRAVLQAQRVVPKQFALRDASTSGDGLADGVDLGDWAQLRAMIYDENVR